MYIKPEYDVTHEELKLMGSVVRYLRVFSDDGIHVSMFDLVLDFEQSGYTEQQILHAVERLIAFGLVKYANEGLELNNSISMV